MSSAYCVGVRMDTAMSLVTWSPAIGITAVWRMAPCENTARSVVPPPMSMMQTPSSFSSSVRHGEARGELLEHDVVDFEAAALDALLDVLRRALGAGDDVHLGLEPHARHADRIADAFLAVDDEFLRQHVQDLLVRRDRHGLGRVDHVLRRRRRSPRGRGSRPRRASSGCARGCRRCRRTPSGSRSRP